MKRSISILALTAPVFCLMALAAHAPSARAAAAVSTATDERASPIRALLPANLPLNFPDDDEVNAKVDSRLHYTPMISAPQWVVPSDKLPVEVRDQRSNNNVAIGYFNGRLYLAWRTAPNHFASKKTHMYVVSSEDFGASWKYETKIAFKSDVREPYFLSFKGRFIMTFFQGGKHATSFDPKKMWRIEKLADGTWSQPETWGQAGEIPWEIKVRGGRAWKTSYKGDHYKASSGINVYFQVSDDGVNWSPVDPAQPVSYFGGVSEVAFDFAADGTLWGVTRNEDGDKTGFGSQVISAPASNLASWQTPAKSNPQRFDSPRMFRHGRDLFLIARRDIDGPFDKGWRFLPQPLRKLVLWLKYWRRPKRTALYRVDTDHRRVRHVMDLPSAGDTAFPSILRVDPDTYLVANYTSPLEHVDRDWLWGQISPQGTQIYFLVLRFEPQAMQ